MCEDGPFSSITAHRYPLVYYPRRFEAGRWFCYMIALVKRLFKKFLYLEEISNRLVLKVSTGDLNK